MSRQSCRAAAAIFLLALVLVPTARAAECEDPVTLHFALATTGKPAQQLRRYLPVLDLLAAETGRPVDVLLPGSEASAIEALGGWAHLGVLTAETYVAARAAHPSIAPFAAPGRAPGHLQTEASGPEVVLISTKGSRIRKWKAAKGAVAGVADRESVLDYRVPAVVFAARAGAALDSYFSEVVTTGSHEDSLDALIEGRLDVAFLAAKSLDRLIDKQKLLLEDIILLWRSPPLPVDSLVFGAGLCDDLKKTIAELFLTLHNRFEVRQFLESFKSPRMLPVTDADYQIIRDLQAAAAAAPAE